MQNIVPSDQYRSLTALGAGDLIDRAVRFYRKNFWTLILIAAPPVFVGTLFSVTWTFLAREMFSASVSQEKVFYQVFLALGAILIWLIECIATLVIMGGASRNFVRHLLFGETISFGETYRNTGRRLGGLVTVSTLITILLGTFGFILFYIGVLVATLTIFLVITVLQAIPVLAFIISVALAIVIAGATLWLFFLVASRFAYVQQVMLVEGQGVFSAVARSAAIASGSVRRLMALFIFTTFATYSALAILYVPLGWYAWVNGVEIMSFSRGDLIPAWYEVAYSMISQISFILLSPVWTIGLCLLYVDLRVRGEGYDIELAAARQLGEIPQVPQDYVNPLQPALGSVRAIPASTHVGTESKRNSRLTTLGLD